MTNEEKVKAYDEALERAKRLHREPTGGTERIVCEQIFPELKESKDEKIRKELYKYFSDLQLSSDSEFSPLISIDEILSWLEKQANISKTNKKLRQYREYLVKETERWHKKEEDETLSKMGKQDCIGHANAYVSARSEFEDLFNYDSWLEKQGKKTPQWMIDFLENHRKNFGISMDYDERREVDGKLFSILKWLNGNPQIEQNPAWSEEDKFMIQDAIHWIKEFQKSNRCKDENDMQNSVTCEEWLKSLKKRIQQP